MFILITYIGISAGIIVSSHTHVYAQSELNNSDSLCNSEGVCQDISAEDVQNLIDNQDEMLQSGINESENQIVASNETFNHDLKLAKEQIEKPKTAKDSISSTLFFVITILFIILAINGILILIFGSLHFEFTQYLIIIETWLFRVVVFCIAMILIVMYI